MKNKIFLSLLLILFSCIAFSNNDGNESDDHQPRNFSSLNFSPVKGRGILTYIFQYTGVHSVYDFQSNAVPNQIWQDPMVPSNVHATFMYSLDPDLLTKACAYIFSTDAGSSWIVLGDVPNTGRAGFPSITGFPDMLGGSSAVLANQNTTNGTTSRAKINYDAGPGFGVFTEIDPGLLPGSIEPLFPRILGLPEHKLIMAVRGNTIVTLNNGPPWTFSDWTPFPSSGAETYFLSLAPNGTVGHTFIGLEGTDEEHDAFYRYSTDNGITWATSVKIWNWNPVDSLGVLRGISMVFGNNNKPYVTFEVSKLGQDETFFPELPSSIRVWSPDINGGVPTIVADQTTVPFFANRGNTSDAFLPLSRPSIGRTLLNSSLSIVFNATTGIYGTDSSSYYSSWIVYSLDNGSQWHEPDRMTPLAPLYDWRFVNISQTSKSNAFRILCQADSIPGTQISGTANANAIGILAYFPEININSQNSLENTNYNLLQNTPNPFNPITKISFEIPKSTNVTLKVFDSNGREVQTLINNEMMSPGLKEFYFDGSNLSSGIYFYTLETEDFRKTRKMILLK